MLGVCSDLRKVCGVAQARVTSTLKVAGSNPAAGESRRSSGVERWTVSSREFPPQRNRDGAEQRFFDTNGRRGRQLRTLAIYSSRFEIVSAPWKTSGLTA